MQCTCYNTVHLCRPLTTNASVSPLVYCSAPNGFDRTWETTLVKEDWIPHLSTTFSVIGITIKIGLQAGLNGRLQLRLNPVNISVTLGEASTG